MTSLRHKVVAESSLRMPTRLLGLLKAVALLGALSAGVLAQSQNRPPEFLEAETTERYVTEAVAMGANIGDPVEAEDRDGDTLTYSLAGSDDDSFDIDSSNGQISLAQGATLDYENPADADMDNDYEVEVRVTDGRDAQGGNDTSVDASIEVTIKVSNVNEAPSFPSDSETSFEVRENTASGVNVGDPVPASDPEGDTLTYSLTGTDSGSFDVTSSGQIRTKSSLDYETKFSYSFSVKSVDPGGLSASILVSVSVTDDVTEAPGKPSSPTVKPNAASGHDSLDVSWSVPSNTGPSITGYDVQYRLEGGSEDGWTDHSTAGTSTSTTISGLDSGSSYEVRVRAENDEGQGRWSEPGSGDTDSAPPAPNLAPRISGSTAVDFSENGSGDVAVYSATDDEGHNVSWSLAGSDGATFTISQSGGVRFRVSPDFESPSDSDRDGVYDLGVVALDDGSPAASSTLAVMVTVTDVNEPPSFPSDSETSFEVRENAASGVNVGDPVRASDPDGDTLTYSLAGADSGSFAIDTSSGQIRTKSSLDFESPSDSDRDGVYDLGVVALDDGSPAASSTLAVMVTVTDVNESPSFPSDSETSFEVRENAGSGVNVGDPVRANDPEGDTLTYSLTGTDSGSFDVTSSGQIRTKSSLDYETKSSYSFSVKAVDPDGLSASILVSVSVTDDVTEAPGKPSSPTVKPNAASGHDSLDVSWSVPSNTGPSITGYDVQYRLGGDGWTDHSTVGTSTSTTISGLDSGSSYEVRVRAENDEGQGRWSEPGSGDTDSAPARNLAPRISGSTAVEFSENGSGDVAVYSATDDEGHNVSWSLAGTDGGAFTISQSGALRFRVSPDFESPSDSDRDGVYDLGVVALDDGSPAASSTLAVMVTVTDVNESPSFPSDSETSFEVRENAGSGVNVGDPVRASDPEGDTLTYSLTGTDSGSFAIDTSSGQIRTKSSLDFESPSDSGGDGVYDLNVVALDDGSPAASSTLAVMVTVTDVNESPSFPSDSETSFEVRENAGSGVNVGDPVRASDPDGDTLTYSLAGADSGSFAIDTSSGQIRTKSSLDFESPSDSDRDGVYDLSVVALDDGSPAASSTLAVMVTVTDVNEPPSFPSDSETSFEVRENAASGVNVGDPVRASDPEGDTLTYSLAGTDSGSFAIDTSSGQIKTKSSLDYETKSSYSFSVKAVDPGGLSASISVSVSVTDDVTEAPGKPSSPTVKPNAASGHGSLDVSWSVPSNAGPSITGYDVQYRLEGGGGDGWTDHSTAGTSTSTTISGLDSGSSYEVRVRAENDEGQGRWSEPVSGDTDSAPARNLAPRISGSTAVDFSENGSGDVAVYSATDDDGHNVSWSLAGSDGGAFTISQSGGVRFRVSPDFESPSDNDRDGVYDLSVVALDDGSPAASSTLAVLVTVTDVNEPPSFPSDSGTSFEVRENAASGVNVGDPVRASDPDGDTLTYSLTGADSGSFAIDTSSGQIRTKSSLDFESPSDNDRDGVYDLSVVALDDGSPAASSTLAVVVTVTDVNESPSFPSDSETSFEVRENAVSGVNVGDPVPASDPDGDTLTYSLTGTDSGSFAIDRSSGQIRTKSSLDFESPSDNDRDGVYDLSVVALDDGSPAASSTLAVVVTVTDVNESPSFPSDSETSFEVRENAVSGVNVGDPVPASDPDGDTLTYSLTGTDSGSFAIDRSSGQIRTKSSLDFESPSDSDRDGVYDLNVVAVDDGSPAASSTLAVMVTVTDVNESPSFPSDSETSFEVRENAASGVNVGDPVRASDPDGDTLTYSLTGADSGSFAIDRSSGQIRTKSSLDFESPSDSDRDGVYDLNVVAVDDGSPAASSTLAVMVTVTDVNESPSFPSDSETSFEVRENTASGVNVGDPVRASDPDGDTLTYSLTGADSGSFAIDRSSGQIRTKSSLDFESPSDNGGDGVYDLSVVAVDDGSPAASSTLAVMVTVTDVNESPSFPSDSETSFEVRENTASGVNVGDPVRASDPDGDTLTYSLAGTDSGSFAIDRSSGQIRTKSSLDYETKSSYSFSVKAVDPGGLSASILVSVSVTDDVTEAPGKPSSPTVKPNAASGHDSLDVSWSVPSNTGPSITGYDVQYRLEGGGEDGWTDHSTAGTSTSTTISGLDSGSSYEVRVRAENDEGQGRWSEPGKGDTLSAPPINSNPSFLEGDDASREVNENVGAGMNVGKSVSAQDPDEGDTLTYSVTGDDADLFSIDSSNGQIRTKTPLNFEDPSDADQDNSYELAVQVSDGKDLNGNADDAVDDSITVTVTVNDVNEISDILGPPRVMFYEHSNYPVAAYVATDPEGHTITWSLDGVDKDLFIISQSGGLSFRTSPDFEDPSDSGAENVYGLSIGVVDDGTPTASSTLRVTITVQNVDEPGRMFLSTLKPELGVEVTAELTDPDMGLMGMSWQWYRVDSQVSQKLTRITNAIQERYTPVAADSGKILVATVSYTDGHGAGKYAEASTTSAVSEDPNTAPAFPLDTLTSLTVSENTSPDRNIGDPVKANDPDGDALIYSLAGDDANLFALDASTGQIKTKSLLDFEVQSTYRVVVTATDPGNLYESIDVTIRVEDVDTEAPATPTAPRVTPNRFDPVESLTVRWMAPANTGPPITSYDVRYKISGTTNWVQQQVSGGSLSVDIGDLDSDTSYEVQVRASNGEGTGGWSASRLGATLLVRPANTAPEFIEYSGATRQVTENAIAGTSVGGPVKANDPDQADTLTYSMTGRDATLFNFDSSGGQISIKEPLDFEDPSYTGRDNGYEVMVQVSDGRDDAGNADDVVDDSISVVITVVDVKEPPGKPDPPAATPNASRGHNSLDVSWTAPENSGPPVTDYDMRYRVDGSGDVGWTDHAIIGTSTSTIISGLVASTSYDVIVRASNIDGPGEWSESGRASTAAAPPTGGVFPPPSPPPPGGSSRPEEPEPDLSDGLLDDVGVKVRPSEISLALGETVTMRATAYNVNGQPLPPDALGVIYVWSSSIGGSFDPNNSRDAYRSIFTASNSGEGEITVTVTQGEIVATGSADLAVAAPIEPEDESPNGEEEELPKIIFPAGASGVVVFPTESALVTSPNGITMYIPAGTVAAPYAGAYIVDLDPRDINIPEDAGFAVGSHVGDLSFTDVNGRRVPGFRAKAVVRVCLPITNQDIEMAYGGIEGISIINEISAGEFVRLPSDSDPTAMVACAGVTRFSLFFVGLNLAPAENGPVVPDSTMGSPVLPATGDFSPSTSSLILTFLAGLALVVVGGLALIQAVAMRSREQPHDNETFVEAALTSSSGEPAHQTGRSKLV